MARIYSLQDYHPPHSPSGIDFKSLLNSEQYTAVSSSANHALIIAGAGSGKTRTLTYRVAWLLEHQIHAKQILLLTFTNKAAKEMMERVTTLIPQDLSSLWAGTFHSIANRILRRHAEALNFTPSFSILDSDDRKSLIKQTLASLSIDQKNKRFPKPELLSSLLSFALNTCQEIEHVIQNNYPYLLEWKHEIQQLAVAFHQRKKDTNAMDFDDLLSNVVNLLQHHSEIRAFYQTKFKHVLVDEYQDTNRLQSQMIDLLIGRENTLMAVGDDAQSIYSWRGADLNHILNFQERYSNAAIFKIQTNYRSVPEILALSNAAIRENKARYEKNLEASRPQLGAKPALIPLDHPGIQAAFVAQRIEELHRDFGVPYSEMAILYRAHFHSLEVQMELTARDIPFMITSGLRFFEQAHIKDVSAFLRLVTNPLDEMCFKRITQLIPGCGSGTAEKLWAAWFHTVQKQALPAQWSDFLLTLKIPKKSEQYWKQCAYILDELRPNGALAKPKDMIYSVLEGIYDDYLRASYDNYESRRNDIEQLMTFSSQFEQIDDFLAQLSLLNSTDQQVSENQDQSKDQVTLSSIHQAKGLEWQSVFLIWLAEGYFPTQRTIDSENAEIMEEERRLFYVALTRAKDEIYLTYPMFNPKSYNGNVICQASSFLHECPDDLFERWYLSKSDSAHNDPF